MEYVRLPMVRTDEKAMVAGYVVYRLPEQVSHVLGLGASTARWSVHPSQRPMFVTCEKAENGKLYAVAVSEATMAEMDRLHDVVEIQAALPEVVVVEGVNAADDAARLEALWLKAGGLILDIPEVKE